MKKKQKKVAFKPVTFALLACAIVVVTIFMSSRNSTPNKAIALQQPRWYTTPVPDQNSSDKTPPTVIITSPTQGGTLAKGVGFSITAEVTDETQVAQVAFYISPFANLASKTVCIIYDSGPNFSCMTKSPTKPGTYTITVYAYDTSGNASSPSNVTVTVK